MTEVSSRAEESEPYRKAQELIRGSAEHCTIAVCNEASGASYYQPIDSDGYVYGLWSNDFSPFSLVVDHYCEHVLKTSDAILARVLKRRCRGVKV